MPQVQRFYNRHITVTDKHSDGIYTSKQGTKHDIEHNISDIEYQNSFIPKQVLRPDNKITFDYNGFLMQGHMYYSLALDLPKESTCS